MRRRVIAITALMCLVAAGSAYAAGAFNKYTASYKFAGAAGSKSKPAAAGFTLIYTAANTNSTETAEPLKDIKSTLDGIKANGKDFPTCSAKTIGTAPGYNNNCAKGSEVASGPVKAIIGGQDDTKKGTGFSCSLELYVYNSAGAKLTYFLTVPKVNGCGPLTTGDAEPYAATTKEVHGNLLENVPLPPDVSTDAGGEGLWASLVHETLTFKKMTRKVHGKTVPFLASTGCKGKRNWSVTFTATNGKTNQSKTISGKAKC